jgi:hypothetical protein
MAPNLPAETAGRFVINLSGLPWPRHGRLLQWMVRQLNAKPAMVTFIVAKPMFFRLVL